MPRGKNGPGKRTWELGVGMANGRGDFIGPPAWFLNSEPVQESQEGEGGSYAPGSLLGWSLLLSGGLSHNSLLPGSSSHFFSSPAGLGVAKSFLTSHPYLCKKSLNNPNLSAAVCWNAEKYSGV